MLASTSTGANMEKLWEVANGRPRGPLVMLRNDQSLVITADGHYRGSPRVEREMVYSIHTELGDQEILTPEEFAAKFSWKNDPERVLLIATPTKPPSEIVASPAGSLVGPERRAAEWVLSLGGSLRIRRGDAEREIVAANDLPAGELQVVFVLLNHHRVTDADLEHLKALPRLRRLYLGNCGGSGAGLENLKVLPNL